MNQSDTVITCHRNADFDAIASLIGATELYPGAILIFPGTQERALQSFFDNALQYLYDFRSIKDIDLDSIRRVVVVDTRQPDRVGHIKPLLDKALQNKNNIEIHVWDHHPDTQDMIVAQISHVEDVASTATLLVEAMQKKGHHIGCEAATLLGLGVYGDTGSFTFSSTSEREFEAAAWLLRHGMDTNSIGNLVRHDMTREQLRALNEMLENAEMHDVGGYTIAVASTRLDGYLNDFAVLAPRFMEMQPCQVFFALGAMEDKIQVVARSQVESVDVGGLCRKLGGGGHQYAAAATVRDQALPELKDYIMAQVSVLANRDKTAGLMMSAPVVGVEESASIRKAESIMSRYGLKAVPVFRVHTRVCVGWLEHQVADKAVVHGLGHVAVGDYMQRNFHVVTRGADLQALMDIIVGARQRLVPVVDGPDPSNPAQVSSDDELNERPLVGVVTRTDLIRLFMDDDAARLPQPRQKSQRERNLSRALRTRMPAPCVRLLEMTGQLGTRLGVKVYVVGGFVRDLIMEQKGRGWPHMDIDLVVEGDALAFAHALSHELKGRVREHRTFMTALVLFPASSLEKSSKSTGSPESEAAIATAIASDMELRVDVATARLEYYAAPAALPTVELSSIKMDLYRRDFTINAMAMQLNEESFGLLVDFFDGQSDIRQKRIRMLHALSFVEDPTRALRAVRFEQRYRFRIGPQCERLIHNALELHLMDKLSGIRILNEIELMLEERESLACITRMQELDMLTAIHPHLLLHPWKAELLDKSLRVLEWYRRLYLPEVPDPLFLFFMAFCRNLSGSEMMEVLTRFDLPEIRRTTMLSIRAAVIEAMPALELWQSENGSPSRLYFILDHMPLEGLLYLIARVDDEALQKALSQYVYHGRKEKADIDGTDLRELGLIPGPAYSRILRAVLAAKLDGTAPTREEQLALAQERVQDEMGKPAPPRKRA